MNSRNDFGRRGNRFKQSYSQSSDRGHGDFQERPRRESSWSEAPDISITGCEARYLETLMEDNKSLVIVLRQGERILGRIAWHDKACIKIAPSDGSASLLIPKTSIKYLYEEVLSHLIAQEEL